ncbi:MAG: hypothetical protein J6D03_09795 [Clostridia bacterium]|nr:hypothetical protein [Clostridia bacterium]
MSKNKTNYKMKTFEKLKTLGVTNDKDILNLKIEDLKRLQDLQLRDVLNIIELRESIKTNGLVGYLFDIQKE